MTVVSGGCRNKTNAETQNIRVVSRGVPLEGILSIPEGAKGFVVFVHGSGSSRHSSRNQFVARTLQEGGLATLLFDLLTPEEEKIDLQTCHLRFNMDLLAKRTAGAMEWLDLQPDAHKWIGAGTSLGYNLLKLF